MNYILIYEKLIQKCKTRILSDGCYTEKHHILPECMGGETCVDNIVILTAREHYLAHKLLYYSHPNNSKLFYAWHMMAFKKTDIQRRYEISSREYEILMTHYRKFRQNIPRSEETKAKLRISALGYKHTDESKRKISDVMKGRKITEEQKILIGNAHRGKKVSLETKQKQRLAHLGKKRIFSESHKKKLSDAAKLRGNNRNGVKHSEETKKKMSESAKKRNFNGGGV